MVSRALILAAGQGTRLAPLTEYIPKELIEIDGKAVIESLVESILSAGISEIQIVISPIKYSIVRCLGSGSKYGAEITYRVQEEPLGTADAVARCREFVGDESFLVAYGDTYLQDSDALRRLIDVFEKKKVDFALLVQRILDPDDFGLVKLDKKDNVISLIEKPDPVQATQYKTGDSYLAIRGFLALKSNIMPFITDTKPGKNGERWLTDSLKKALLKGYRGAVHVSESEIFDIGTPEVLKELEFLIRK